MQVHGTLLQLRQLVTAASQVLEVTPNWLQLLPVRLQKSACLLLPASPACPAVRSALLSLLTSLQSAPAGPASQLICSSAAQDGEVGMDSSSAPGNGLRRAAYASATTALEKITHEAAAAALETTRRDVWDQPGVKAGPNSRASIDSRAQSSNQKSQGTTLQLPYQAVWLKQATKALLHAPGISRDLAAVSGQLLQHPGSEVRAAAAKVLLIHAAKGTAKPCIVPCKPC